MEKLKNVRKDVKLPKNIIPTNTYVSKNTYVFPPNMKTFFENKNENVCKASSSDAATYATTPSYVVPDALTPIVSPRYDEKSFYEKNFKDKKILHELNMVNNNGLKDELGIIGNEFDAADDGTALNGINNDDEVRMNGDMMTNGDELMNKNNQYHHHMVQHHHQMVQHHHHKNHLHHHHKIIIY